MANPNRRHSAAPSPRHPTPRPRHDIPSLEAAPWPFGEYQVRPEVSQLKQHKHIVLRQCSYCGTNAPRNLSQCSRCMSARYCSPACQTADYLEKHRQECLGFSDPPFTTAFLTTPIGHAHYAVDPLIGRGDLDEVFRRLRLTEADQETSLKYKVHTSNLLTLQILVQNGRKDGLLAVIFGALCQVITCAGVMEAVHTGSPGDDVEIVNGFCHMLLVGLITAPHINSTLESEKKDVSSVGCAYDPWDKTPRVLIKNFNGTEVNLLCLHQGNTLPSAVLSASRGIVELYPGDFALLHHVQFRIGEGRRAGINKDFMAL